MNCAQDQGILIEFINLGALPCFGIGLIGLLIIKLIVYMISRETSQEHSTDGDMMAIIAALLSIYFLAIFIGIGFFAGIMSILRNLIAGQPIHWY